MLEEHIASGFDDNVIDFQTDVQAGASDSDSGILRRQELERGRREGLVWVLLPDISYAIDQFADQYLAEHGGVTLDLPQSADAIMTQRRLVIHNATKQQALRVLFADAAVTGVELQSDQPVTVRHEWSYEEFRNGAARRIASHLAEHELRSMQGECAHIDLETARMTTDSVMQLIFEHPQMSYERIIDGFFGSKK